MDHTLNLTAVFCFYRQTVSAAAHSNQVILEHGSHGGRIHHGV